MAYDLGTAHGKIELDYSGKAAVASAKKDLDSLDKQAGKNEKSIEKFSSALSAVGAVAKKAALGGLFIEAGVGAANLAINILGIVPNLVSIGSLAAALPAAFTGMIASVGVLKAAFQGVGDAIKDAFDPKKAAQFDEALKALSPSAAAFAKAVKTAVPALKDVQQGLQEAFFSASHLATAVPLVVKAFSALSPELNGLAGDFGELTRQATNFALSDDSIAFLSNAIGAFRAGLSEASSALIPLLTGIRAVGGVGTPLLTRMGELVGQVGTQFGNFLTAIASDGRLNAWISEGIATLKTLLGIVKNVGNIIFSVISAANAVGGGFLNTLEGITGTFATFLKSAQGATAIRDLFAAIQAVAAPLAPIITTLAGSLIKALAPAVEKIAGALGPELMTVVQNLAPAFAPLATAIATIATAIIPVLGPLSQLIGFVAQFAGIIVSQLGSSLAPVIAQLSGGLSTAIAGLAPVLTAVSGQMPAIATAASQLFAALQPLIPVFVQVAASVSQGLVQSMPQLASSATQLLVALTPLVSMLASGLAAVLIKINPYIPLLVQSFFAFNSAALQVAAIIAQLITWAIQLYQWFSKLPAVVVGLANTLRGVLLGALQTAATAVGTAVVAMGNFFAALPGRIGAALARLPGLILGVIRGALSAAATAVGFGIGLLVGLFTKFPGDAYNAIRSLISSIPSVLRSAWNAASSATSSAISAIVGVARGLTGRVRSAISSLVGALRSVASSAWNSFKSATTSGANGVVSYVRGLPGRLRSALGSLGSLLYSSGVNIVNGLLNGIKNAAGGVLSEARNLASQVKSAFDSALSIFSPSRKFMESGEFIDEGLILGIRNKMSNVVKVANDLAKTVIDPTIQVPNIATTALSTVTALPAAKAATIDAGAQMGPYELKVDQGTLAAFTIDAVTGNPRPVAAAVTEGNRQKSWAGSGRNN